MIGLFDHLVRPLLRRLDPETAHGLAVSALKIAPLPRAGADDEKLRVEAFGLWFPNPIGLAAGFDKHAEVIDPLLRLGFGFVEAGGVTPKTRASSTASASTAMGSRPSRSASPRARARPASSGSISAPTKIRSIAPPIM
jgi:hypothetical protein